MFALTHFGPKKHTFIDVYCQQVLVANNLKRLSFLAHISHENLKLIIFSAYLLCITTLRSQIDGGVLINEGVGKIHKI